MADNFSFSTTKVVDLGLNQNRYDKKYFMLIARTLFLGL